MKNITDLKTAAAYIRVSTDHQTELSPDSQIKMIRQYAKQHGYIVPNEFIFRDDGISGRRADKRPEFIRMIGEAKKKPSPFSAILLWKFSRFARNQEESIFYKAQLRRNNVEVVSVSEPIIDGPFGSLIERIIEWTDEYYSIRLSGEVKRGMIEKVERGQAVSIPSFGYRIENKKYIPDPNTAPLAQKIFFDYLDGVPIIRIARELNSLGIKTNRGNVWENRTVEYILRNPVYIGKIRWNPNRRTRRNYTDSDIMIVDGEHEPIISEEVFAAVQKKLDENKKRTASYVHSEVKSEYMLHGLVRCSECGRMLTMAQKGKGLQCVGYIHGQCKTSHYISLNKINELVISAVETAFESGAFEIAEKRPVSDEPEIDIDLLIEKENTKLRRIREAYEYGVYTLKEFMESKEQTEKVISRLRESAPKPPDNSDELKQAFAEKNKPLIPLLKTDSTPESEKNEILKSFLDHVTFNRTASKVEISFYR